MPVGPPGPGGGDRSLTTRRPASISSSSADVDSGLIVFQALSVGNAWFIALIVGALLRNLASKEFTQKANVNRTVLLI